MTNEQTFYEAQQNSDLTEGKGHMVAFATYRTEEAALKAVRGKGVMGVGDGEIVEVAYEWSNDEDEVFVTRTRTYGYRLGWNGQWGSGWVDNRDAPEKNPEYQEYVRLKEKFEK